MGNRPAFDHHQPHLHLAVARFAIAAVSKVSQTRWPASLKISARQVVEDHLHLKVEQIAQPAKEFHFDTFFARQQLVERAIPFLEPVEVYPYSTLLFPASQNPLSITSTDKSLSSHCASACSLPGRQRRLATSTSTRSAKRSLSAFCTPFVFGTNPSRMLSKPNSRHSQRATNIGPQQAARVASMGSAQVAELDLVFLPPPSSSMRLSRCGARRSLRPKLATTRCLERPFSQ